MTAVTLLKEWHKNSEINKNQRIAARIQHDLDIVTHKTLTIRDYSLHYVSSSESTSLDQEKTPVIFVHGTPGSWGTFSRYFEEIPFITDFKLYSIDRPGWGASGYSGKKFPVSLSEQSTLIGPMLKRIWQDNGQQKMIIVGHSLGGSLVPKLAVDYPDYLKGVVVLAGDLDPILSEARWFNYLLDWLPDSFLPDIWQNSNDEVLAIKSSLEGFQKEFASITMPINVLQGSEDSLVRPGSAVKAPAIFPSSDVNVTLLEGATHIINHTHLEQVKAAIYEMEARSDTSK
nr:alpha/beta hydrolase [Marinomonas sp.]